MWWERGERKRGKKATREREAGKGEEAGGERKENERKKKHRDDSVGEMMGIKGKNGTGQSRTKLNIAGDITRDKTNSPPEQK